MQTSRLRPAACRLVLAAACACGSTAEPLSGDGHDHPTNPSDDSNARAGDANLIDAGADVDLALSASVTLSPAEVVDNGTHEVQGVVGRPVVLNLPKVAATAGATLIWTVEPPTPLQAGTPEATTIAVAGAASIAGEKVTLATTGAAAMTYDVLAKYTGEVAGVATATGTVTVHVVLSAAAT